MQYDDERNEVYYTPKEEAAIAAFNAEVYGSFDVAAFKQTTRAKMLKLLGEELKREMGAQLTNAEMRDMMESMNDSLQDAFGDLLIDGEE